MSDPAAMGGTEAGGPARNPAKPRRTLKLAVYLFGLAGTAFFVVLLLREGIGDVFKVVAMAGWGLLAVTAFHVVPLLLDAAGWRAVFPQKERPRVTQLCWMRWMGESVNNLIPSVQVGGDILRARLIAIKGTPAPLAAASVIVTVTLNVFTQIIFTLMGFALVISVTRQTSLAKPALAGAALSVLAIGGFYAVQRFGGIRWAAGMMSKMAGNAWRSLLQDAHALDRSIQEIYARPAAVLASGAWAMVSWIIGAVEIWIALRAIGMPASFVQAFALESISQGCRTAMFFIPGGLGVQEGGYLFTGKVLDIPGETALALAMIRRVRELAIGVPGLLAWQFLEGSRLRREATLSGGQITPPAPLPPQQTPHPDAFSGPH